MKVTTSNRLKQLMYERSLKQVDILNACQPFCEKHGVKLGRNDLSQYVSGKVIPGQQKLSILSMALGVNELWLMGYNVPMDRYAFYDDITDAEIVDTITPHLNPKQNLPLVFEAVKTLLNISGIDIFKSDDKFHLINDNGGIQLTDEEANQLLNTIVLSAKNAADAFASGKVNNFFNFLSNENK